MKDELRTMKGERLRLRPKNRNVSENTVIDDVVQKLKETSKGKLRYGSDDIDLNKLTLHLPSSIPLHSATSNNKKVLPVDAAAAAKTGLKYQDYLATPSRHAKNGAPKSSLKTVPSASRERLAKQKSEHSVPLQSELYMRKSQEVAALTHVYDREYEATLTRLSSERLARLHSVMGELAVEHDEALLAIENDIQKRLDREEKYIEQHDHLVSSSSEQVLLTFRESHTSHASNTETKLKLLEREKADISRQQVAIDEQRQRTHLEMKELDMLATSVTTTANNVHNKLDECAQKNVRPNEVAALTSELQGWHTSCAETIQEGLSTQHDLQNKINYTKSAVERMGVMLAEASGILHNAEKEATEKNQAEEAKQQAEKLRLEEEARKASAIASAAPPDQQQAGTLPPVTAQPPPPPPPPDITTTSTTAPASTNATPDLGVISTSVLSEHTRLMKLLEDTVASYQKITASKDKAIKQFEFDMNRAVNTTVNAISDRSPSELLQKIAKLSSFVAGTGEIELGNKKITTAGQPTAIALCKDAFARKLVRQGCEQVSSNHEAAFPFAAVAVAVAATDRSISDLVVANFYKKCPLLVPFYVTREEGQTDAQYYETLGYDVSSSGVVEDTDLYLKKLSGVVRMYASLLQADLPPQITASVNVPHPHGIEHAWTWFSRILNQDPHPTVTALILFDFLSVAGHALMRRYGRQFQKVLRVLCTDYIPKIEAVTKPDATAYTNRLKLYLEECIKTGELSVPEGHLTKEWWTTAAAVVSHAW